MVRNPARDERQGDLFGVPPPPAKPIRRAAAPGRTVEAAPAREAVALATSGQRVTRAEIDDLLDSLPDQELACLAVEVTRLVKRWLARVQGRGPRPKGIGKGKSPLEEALRRIGGELMEFEEPDETW